MRLTLLVVLPAALLLALAGCATSSTPVTPSTASVNMKVDTAHIHEANVHVIAETPGTCPVCNVYEQRRDSVVRIRTESGLGTGVVIDGMGTVLTNAHVVGDAAMVLVETYHGTIVKGTVTRKGKDLDLAVIRVAAPDVKWLAIAPVDAPDAVVGSPVYVIGHPAGLGWTLTAGVISAQRRAGETQRGPLIQISAAVSPGNSGGPAFDERAQWIGTVVSKLVGPGLENLNFVIPASEVRRFLAEK